VIRAGVPVFVALEPVDRRSGFERLAGLAQQHTGYDARCGTLFVLTGRRGTAAKVLFFDGYPFCKPRSPCVCASWRLGVAPSRARARAALTFQCTSVTVPFPLFARRSSLNTANDRLSPKQGFISLFPSPCGSASVCGVASPLRAASTRRSKRLADLASLSTMGKDL